MLVKSGTGSIIYPQSESDIPVQLEAGKYQLKFVDGKTGEITVLNKSINGNQLYGLKVDAAKNGAYWFKKL